MKKITWEKYQKEEEIKKNEQKDLKYILIILCLFFTGASFFVCADQCSDTVFGFVTTLLSIIYLLCFFLHEMKVKKDNAELNLYDIIEE